MYNIGYFILSITMIVAAIWIINKYLSIFFEPKKISVLGVVTWSLYVGFQVIIEFNKGKASIWNTAISMILVYLICIGNFYWKGKSNLLIVILFHVIWALIEMLTFLCILLFSVEDSMFNTIGEVISKIVMIIGTYMFSIYWKNKHSTRIPVNYNFALLFIPLGSIYIAVNEFFSYKSDNRNISSMIVFSVLLLFNAIVFEIYSKLSKYFTIEKEKLVYEQQMTMMSRNTEEQKKMLEDFYVEKHNWINELIVLKNSVENSDKNTVIQDINRIIRVCDVGERISNTGNSVVDAIINSKYSVAKEQGIKFNLKIFIPDIIPINQCDIGIILGNTIDNAIDAVKKCRNYNKSIDISMGIKKESLILMVKNPYEHNLKKDKKGDLISTKNELNKHGYGVNSVKKVTEQYAGEVLINDENNQFKITVIMNLKEI